jgi:hypothetical protein
VFENRVLRRIFEPKSQMSVMCSDMGKTDPSLSYTVHSIKSSVHMKTNYLNLEDNNKVLLLEKTDLVKKCVHLLEA